MTDVQFYRGVKIGGIRPELALALVVAQTAWDDLSRRAVDMIVERVDGASVQIRAGLGDAANQVLADSIRRRLTSEFSVELDRRRLRISLAA